MSTVSEITNRIRRQLVDTDDLAYDSSDILQFIAEGVSRFAAETHCCQSEVSVTLSANKHAFSSILSTLGTGVAKKILAVGKILVNDSGGDYWLRKAPFSEMRTQKISSDTTPTRWSIFGENIYFDLDSASSPSVGMTLFCSYIPTAPIDEDSEIGIPVQWDAAIVHYGAFCCRLADRDAGLANGEFAQYELIRTQANEFYKSSLEM